MILPCFPETSQENTSPAFPEPLVMPVPGHNFDDFCLKVFWKPGQKDEEQMMISLWRK